MSKENLTQHHIVKWFSQTYPEYKGLLFSVNNDTFNVKDAQKRKALGLVKGVSDLCLIVPSSGKLAGIEIKAPASRHAKHHIQQQVKWGMNLIWHGGFYLMCSDTAQVEKFMTLLLKNDFVEAYKIQMNAIHDIQDQYDMQTIKF
jgi:hypothetical protein